MRIGFSISPFIMGPNYYEYKPNSLFGLLICVHFARFGRISMPIISKLHWSPTFPVPRSDPESEIRFFARLRILPPVDARALYLVFLAAEPHGRWWLRLVKCSRAPRPDRVESLVGVVRSPWGQVAARRELSEGRLQTPPSAANPQSEYSHPHPACSSVLRV